MHSGEVVTTKGATIKEDTIKEDTTKEDTIRVDFLEMVDILQEVETVVINIENRRHIF